MYPPCEMHLRCCKKNWLVKLVSLDIRVPNNQANARGVYLTWMQSHSICSAVVFYVSEVETFHGHDPIWKNLTSIIGTVNK